MGQPDGISCSRGPYVSSVPERGELWQCEIPEIQGRPVMRSRTAAIPRRRTLIAPSGRKKRRERSRRRRVEDQGPGE